MCLTGVIKPQTLVHKPYTLNPEPQTALNPIPTLKGPRKPLNPKPFSLRASRKLQKHLGDSGASPGQDAQKVPKYPKLVFEYPRDVLQ